MLKESTRSNKAYLIEFVGLLESLVSIYLFYYSAYTRYHFIYCTCFSVPYFNVNRLLKLSP